MSSSADDPKTKLFADLGSGFKIYGKWGMMINLLSLAIFTFAGLYFSSVTADLTDMREYAAKLLNYLRVNIILTSVFFVSRLVVKFFFFRGLRPVANNPSTYNKRLFSLYVSNIILIFLVVVITIVIILGRLNIAAILKADLTNGLSLSTEYIDSVIDRLLLQDKYIVVCSELFSLYYLILAVVWKKWGENLEPRYRFFPTRGRLPNSTSLLILGSVLYVFIDTIYLVGAFMGFYGQSYIFEIGAIFTYGLAWTQIGHQLLYPGSIPYMGYGSDMGRVRVSTPPSNHPPIVKKRDESHFRPCALCGVKMPPEAPFCSNCGHQFSQ